MRKRDEGYEDLRPSSFPYFGIVLLFLAGAAMGHCWWVGDVIAVGALFAILVGSLFGYFCGLWRSLASTVGMFIGFQFALPVSTRLIPFLEGQFHQSIPPTVGLAISGFATGVVSTLGLLLVGMLLRRNTMFRIVDQYLGGVAGLCSLRCRCCARVLGSAGHGAYHPAVSGDCGKKRNAFTRERHSACRVESAHRIHRRNQEELCHGRFTFLESVC
jgi:hypothetical protein